MYNILVGNVNLVYKKPKIVVQKVKNGHKNPNNSRNYHDENYDEIELYQGNNKEGCYILLSFVA